MSTSSILLGLLIVVFTGNMIVEVDGCNSKSSKCRPDSKRCDGHIDCVGWSDEKDCDRCIDGAFKCSNKRECFPSRFRCDGVNHCSDRSDEINCDACNGGAFKCPNRRKCIRRSRRCNGYNDCGDGSDEKYCDACFGSAFKCSNERKCIHSSWRCDGDNNCGDWSDEKYCSCSGFKCSNGQCISPSNKRCDGSGDCDDNSDEVNCDECNGGAFKCSNERKCIHSSLRCTGVNSCGDWSDEEDCDSCDGGAFYCRNKRECISHNSICDRANCHERDSSANTSRRTVTPAPIAETPRIVEGIDSKPDDWPFMVAVFYTSVSIQYCCGGTILNNRHILTAAHCVVQKRPTGRIVRLTAEQIFVRVGEYDLNSTLERSQDVNVSNILSHEEYNSRTKENDIAIFKLQDNIRFNYRVKAVSLPPSIVDLTDRDAYVIGWGHTSYNGSQSSVLKELMVPIWSQDLCFNAYPRRNFSTTMCAGYAEGGRDACQGDSGGPLLTKLHCSSDWYIVGVVSWGDGCARARKPGVYTRVSDYLGWINNKLG